MGLGPEHRNPMDRFRIQMQKNSEFRIQTWESLRILGTWECLRMDLGMQISNFQYFNISSFSFQIFNVPSVSSFSVFHSFMKPGRSCLIGRNRNSHILEIDRRLFAHAHSCWPCRSLWESTAVSVVSIPFGD